MSWDDVEDPEGRLRKGMLVRWRHGPGGPFMRCLYLCAPGGLYHRPVVPGEEWEKYAVKGMMRCDADEPGAVYDPEGLMVYFRYLPDGGETTGCAIHIEEVPPEMVRKSRAWRGYAVPEDEEGK